MANDPRSTYAYRQARTAWLATAGTTCAQCRRETTLKNGPRHSLAPTVGHTVKVEDRPDLALDTRLWRLLCLGCNVREENDHRAGVDRTQVRTSRPI